MKKLERIIETLKGLLGTIDVGKFELGEDFGGDEAEKEIADTIEEVKDIQLSVGKIFSLSKEIISYNISDEKKHFEEYVLENYGEEDYDKLINMSDTEILEKYDDAHIYITILSLQEILNKLN